MNVARTLFSITIVLGVGACGYLVSVNAAPHLRTTEPTRHPFLLVLSVDNLQNPRREHVGESLIAVNSGGVRLRRFHNSRIAPDLAVQTLSFPDGRVIEFYRAKHITTTTYTDDPALLEQAGRYGYPAVSCIGDSQSAHLLRKELVLGQETEVIQLQTPNARITNWNIPSLGCVTAKYIIEFPGPDGTYALAAIGDPTSLTLGPPPSELFETPREARELPPSAFRTQMREALGIPDAQVSRAETRQLAQRDATYFRQRGNSH